MTDGTPNVVDVSVMPQCLVNANHRQHQLALPRNQQHELQVDAAQPYRRGKRRPLDLRHRLANGLPMAR